MKNSEKKLSTSKYILLFCIIVPLIAAEGMSTLSPILYSVIWRYGRLMSALVVILMFCASMIHGHIRLEFNFIIFIYLGIMALINMACGVGLDPWISNYSNMAVLLLLTFIFRDSLTEVIHIVLVYLEILIVINIICIILYPSGMYYSKNTGYTLNWFLGYKSSLQYYIMPAFALSWLEAKYCGKWRNFFVFALICIIETVMSQNKMLTVSILMLTVIYLFHLTGLKKIFNGYTYAGVVIAVNALLLFYFDYFIHSDWGSKFLSILGKSSTLGGRESIIWPKALLYISKSPIWGYGVLDSDAHIKIYGMYQAIHAHNQFLEVMFSGGIILMFVFCGWLAALVIRMNRTQDLPSTQILGCCIFAVMIMASVEVFTRQVGGAIWLLFFMLADAGRLDRQYKKAGTAGPSGRNGRPRIRIKLNMQRGWNRNV